MRSLFALSAPLLVLCGPAAAAEGGSVRDRLWVWSHDASFYDGGYQLPGKSRITPVEGAVYMGVPNILLIRMAGVPKPPFEQYFVPFKAMKRVYWTLSDNTGQEHALGDEQEHVFRLAAANPNIVGLLLDDYLSGPDRPDLAAQWLANNTPAFPVTMTLALDRPAEATALELLQSDWHSKDYRSARFAIEAQAPGGAWRPAGEGELPNEPGAGIRVALPPGALSGLRIRILSSHDLGLAKSCGLKGIRLWAGEHLLPLTGAHIEASSEYPGHEAKRLLATPLTDARDVRYHSQVSPDELRAVHARLANVAGRKLDLAAVVYAHQLDPAIAPLLQPMDTLLFWTWAPEDLNGLEKNLGTLQRIIPGKRVFLGCYLWDFNAGRPMPMDAMKRQCEVGLRWLKEGRIEGMIFLGTNVCDLGLEAVEWTRQWIRTVGDDALPAR